MSEAYRARYLAHLNGATRGPIIGTMLVFNLGMLVGVIIGIVAGVLIMNVNA